MLIERKYSDTFRINKRSTELQYHSEVNEFYTMEPFDFRKFWVNSKKL